MPGHGEVAAPADDGVARASAAQWRQIVANVERALALRAKRLRHVSAETVSLQREHSKCLIAGMSCTMRLARKRRDPEASKIAAVRNAEQ